MIKTVVSEHGTKEHIITGDSETFSRAVLVACGHNHFEEKEENTQLYEVDEIMNPDRELLDKLCITCRDKVRADPSIVREYSE